MIKKIFKLKVFIYIIIILLISLYLSLKFIIIKSTSSSMIPTIEKNDYLLVFKTKEISCGDMIALKLGDKILIKRVIAKEGQKVDINKDGNVFVNGKFLIENYTSNKTLGLNNIKYPKIVEEDRVFVLSDNRKESIDSRIEEVSTIKKENILGKVVFRALPLSGIKFIKNTYGG